MEIAFFVQLNKIVNLVDSDTWYTRKLSHAKAHEYEYASIWIDKQLHIQI